MWVLSNPSQLVIVVSNIFWCQVRDAILNIVFMSFRCQVRDAILNIVLMSFRCQVRGVLFVVPIPGQVWCVIIPMPGEGLFVSGRASA